MTGIVGIARGAVRIVIAIALAIQVGAPVHAGAASTGAGAQVVVICTAAGLQTVTLTGDPAEDIPLSGGCPCACAIACAGCAPAARLLSAVVIRYDGVMPAWHPERIRERPGRQRPGKRHGTPRSPPSASI